MTFRRLSDHSSGRLLGSELAGTLNAELAGTPNAELAGTPNAELAGTPDAEENLSDFFHLHYGSVVLEGNF